MEIGTKVTFSAAHRLMFHKGQCKNLHGHNWKVDVQIHSSSDDDIVADFGVVKSSIKLLMDHKVLVYEEDTVLMDLTEGMERAVLPFESTAENLARYIWQMIRTTFFGEGEGVVIGVTVYESEDSFACELR